MRRRLRVAVLGATGAVGQKLVCRLVAHPWFELVAVTGSARSAGKRFADAVHWLEPEPLPPAVGRLIVAPTLPNLDVDLAISALDAAAAREAEPTFAAAGLPVITNASPHRMDPTVPLVIPEVNPDHLDLLSAPGRSRGFIVANPNCATVGLVLALKPLHDAFTVERVQVTTLQAASGAGYPGVASLDLLGNVIPGIAGEEEKLACEPRKLLGHVEAGVVREAPIAVSAQTTRVPVLEGHLLSVSVGFARRAPAEDAVEALRGFPSPVADLRLPSSPARPLSMLDGDLEPQPRLHAGLGGGMTVSVGRVRACPVLDLRFVALVHNTVRGAAGAALLNAELLAARGLLSQRL